MVTLHSFQCVATSGKLQTVQSGPVSVFFQFIEPDLRTLNTAVYYDLVNFSDDDSRLRDYSNCDREGKMNFLFLCLKYCTGLYSEVNQG